MLAPPPPRTLILPVPACRPCSHAFPFRLGTQGALAFDQPLSFDTSSVTSMAYMFRVRSARALPQKPLQLGPSPAHCIRCRRPAPSRRPARACHPSSHASLFIRQYASDFNQPLNFDTSNVTDMRYMFQVRLACQPPASCV